MQTYTTTSAAERLRTAAELYQRHGRGETAQRLREVSQAIAGPKIKFNQHHITDGTYKARVHYCASARCDGRQAVTLYAKDFDDGRALSKMFSAEYKNDTEIQSDYHETGRVVLFSDHPLYAPVMQRVAINQAKREARKAARHA